MSPTAGQRGRARAWLLVTAGLLVLLVSGCASSRWIKLRSTPRNPLAAPLQLVSFGGPKPTPRTMQLLRRYDLVDDLSGDRRDLLSKLNQILVNDPKADTVYAVAELAYLGAQRAELRSKQAALDLYGASVMHAYLYLFDPRFAPVNNPYDPHFRGACDLYNASLEGVLRLLRHQGTLRPGRACTIQTASRQIDVHVVLRSSGWQEDDFSHFEFASDYQVRGLRNHYRAYGLGVPLIGVRKPRDPQRPGEQFYPPNLSFPVTAFLRVMPPTAATDGTSPNGPVRLQAMLELFDPLVSTEVQVAGQRVPLETDLTTPLAYFLNQPEFDENRMSNLGLLNPEKAQTLTGLYMLEPFQPGKIPVVMVHGFWSSPVAWMEMFNDLRSEPEIHKHFQFWFYLYPSGQPFWFSAAQMREDLARLRTVVDPYHQQPALDQMVLVGHSMGGLVSKLQTVDSGSEFWNIVSDKPFEQLVATPQDRNTFAHTFFFQPNPSIRRVITIGTPHRGSRFANETTRWIGRRLISMPVRMLQGRQKLVRDNPGYFRQDGPLGIDTSIDSLVPDSPFLSVLLRARPGPWVSYHNIIGQVPETAFLGRVSGESDGVVSLASAHLTDVATEIVVPADHLSVHRHPRTILEVRRVLLEHLQSLRSYPVYPARRLPPVRSAGREAGGQVTAHRRQSRP